MRIISPVMHAYFSRPITLQLGWTRHSR